MNEARRVILAPYDPSWPSMYDEARREITEAVGDDILGIEHVESTAVPGLTAKAAIDILVDVGDCDEAKVTIRPLEKIGWEYRGKTLSVRRHFLRKMDAQGHRSHHLHILEISDPHRDEMVLFRDFLRSNPNIAEDYAALKRDLAEQFAESRSEYIQRKDPFI